MTMSEARRRELLEASALGRETLEEQSGQSNSDQPAAPTLSPSQKRDIAVLQEKLDKVRAGLDSLERAKFEASLWVDPARVNAALALSELGQQIISEKRLQEIAEAQKAAANQVRPTDKYLSMTPAGKAALEYRKSGGKS